MLRAISLRESWMREIRTSGLTRERAPNGPSLLYNAFHNNAMGYDAVILSGTVNRSRRREGGLGA